MILQALNDLYTRLAEDPNYEIAPQGFSPQKIAFRIRIRQDGSLVQFEDARIPDKKGKKQNIVMLVPGEAKSPGAGINPGLLWDNQTYLLGRQPEDKPAGFALKRFEALRQRHLEAESAIGDLAFSAVCRFLEQWSPTGLEDHPLLKDFGTGFGVFAIQGQKHCVHEAPSVLQWWRKQEAANNEGPAVFSQCLLSGQEAPVARLHPKIKGVSGSQSAGASLVSFNAKAYESYGKEQSFNAPVSEIAAFQYGTALNSLLTGPQSAKHRIRIGDTTTVFWTERPSYVEDCIADLFGGGSSAAEQIEDVGKREQIRRLLDAVRQGSRYQDLGDSDTSFHILGLAPNAARIAIRFYFASTTAELIAKLHDHLRCMQIVRQFTELGGSRLPDPEFPAIWQILRETARVADEIPPLLGGALTRAIIEGVPYPEGLYAAIIRRIHADRTINYLRAATLKAVLVRNHNQSISIMLDLQNTNPAYLLGRLFAALEKTQDDALGSLNSGLKDKFYSSASTTPASVFPRILRTYPHHLAKLQSGAKINRERLVQEIVDHIPSNGFPSQLSLKNQGIFAIGYYHQRKDFFTKKEVPSGEVESVA